MADIKLSQVVGEFLDTINAGPAEYARAYRFAMRGMRNLEWDVTGENYECELPVECDMTVCLPDDFINLVRIGIINSKGEVATLTQNNDLTLSDGLRQGGDYTPTADTVDDFLFSDNNYRVYSSASSLSVGSYPNIGEYKVEREQGLIILNPDFCYDTVTVKYLRRKKVKGEYMINELSVEALVAYIDWQWHKNKPGVSYSDKATKRMEWFNEKRLAKSRIKNTTKQILSQIARQATRQGLKG